MAACAPSDSGPDAIHLSPASSRDDPGCDAASAVDELVPLSTLESLAISSAGRAAWIPRQLGVPTPLLRAALTGVVTVAVLYVGLGVTIDRRHTAHDVPAVATEGSVSADPDRPQERTGRPAARSLATRETARNTRSTRPTRPQAGHRRRTSASSPQQPAPRVWSVPVVRRTLARTAPAAACEFEPSCGDLTGALP